MSKAPAFFIYGLKEDYLQCRDYSIVRGHKNPDGSVVLLAFPCNTRMSDQPDCCSGRGLAEGLPCEVCGCHTGYICPLHPSNHRQPEDE